MKGPITTFWAKLLPGPDGKPFRTADGTPLAWHPLFDHCADVAATLGVLLDQPVLRRWLAALIGQPDLDPVQRARLAFFAALHDVGKVNIGFCNKRFVQPLFQEGHVGPMLTLLGRSWRGPERRRMFEALTLHELASWAEDSNTFFRLFQTTISHHGRPVRPDSVEDARLWRPAGGLDPLAGAAALRREAERWLPDAFGKTTPFPAAPAFQHGFNGLLTLADWIASDSELFPFSDNDGCDRYCWARDRADMVLRWLGLAADAPRRALGAEPPAFSAIHDDPPRELQAQLLKLATGTGGSVTVLEAETGAGKTEAALARFLRLFHAGHVDGLYFALPTRTAATQIHDRVCKAVKRAFPDTATRPPVVLAVPGYLRVDDVQGERKDRFEVGWDFAATAEYAVEREPRLPAPDSRWPDDVRDTLRWRGWAAESSKRFLAGAVVVGTIDQVLLSSLAVSHSHLRAATLARHLLVVDEVHASDAYMTTILESVLSRHLGAGGHAVLMSATLGAAARERLLGAGLGMDVSPRAQAESVPYPLVSHASPPGTTATEIPLARTYEKRILVERAPIAADPLAVAGRALGAARNGARVLVIRNTVRECVATQKALEALAGASGSSVPGGDSVAGGGPVESLLFGCANVPAPHHSRYAREDRQKLDSEIERRFGKDSAGIGCVAVATQTVQQSLDIDADLMLTDLCPMDVLLQRLGRLFRHDRARPAGFEEPGVIVLVPADRDLGRHLREDGSARGPHGIGTVYPDIRILEATLRELEACPVIEIPSMNRALVEAATHPDALCEIERDLDGLWPKHGQMVLGTLLAHGRIARGHLARWDVPFPEAAFPDDGVRIATRLGAEDRVAEFDAPLPGPFGEPVHRVTIPHWLVSGADADARPREIKEGDGIVGFRFGDRRYRYDRLGLAVLGGSTPNDEEDDG